MKQELSTLKLVVIADDHALMREGVKHVLAGLDFEFKTLQAWDYTETIRLISEHEDLDLLLLDLSMPGMERFDGLQRIRDCAPSLPIVVLSASENPEDVQRSLSLGARGYIPKSSSNQVMLAALELVLSGAIYAPPELLQSDSTQITGGNNNGLQNISPKLNTPASARKLTPRQREVLTLLAEGRSDKEISKELGLSGATVRTHLTTIFRILNVRNRTHAGRVALQLGLLNSNQEKS